MEIYVGNQYSSEFIEDVHAVKYLTGKISKGTNLQVFFLRQQKGLLQLSLFFKAACLCVFWSELFLVP